MVKVKLSSKYVNEFLTTHNGTIFYNENNKLGKEANTVDVDLNNIEIANLLQQGILVLANEGLREKKMEPVKVIKEDTPKNRIDSSLKTEEVIEEPKEEVIEEPKEE